MNKIIVLNQKSYMEYNEVLNFINEIKDNIRRDLNVIICPSSIYLPYYKGKYDFKLGSQNVYIKNITGEYTSKSLKSMGVNYVIIGHFERKYYLNEDSNLINLKIKDAINNNLIPIVCLGETKEEKELLRTGDVLIRQLKEYFKDVDVKEDILIAYEPGYSIGTSILPTTSELEEVIKLIKDNIFRKYNCNIKVLYGGSVDETNIEKLNKIKDLDGYLIGKNSSSSAKIIQIMNKID